MDFIAGASPRQLARMAGALYLINIVGGAFAIGVVPAMLVVPGDAAATAHSIQTHEQLYRLGLVAHVVVTVTNVPLAVVFYDLFKVVSRRLALLVVFFTLVETAVEAAGGDRRPGLPGLQLRGPPGTGVCSPYGPLDPAARALW